MAKDKKERKEPEIKKVKKETEVDSETLVRIQGQDIPGSKNVYSGLTRVKGVSWSISNIICKKLNLEKRGKISDLDEEKLQKIEDFLENLKTFEFLKNRRKDLESGESMHLFSTDLEIKKEFDIKRLKKIKSYKGMRHSLKLPVRGQRTRSNFRKSGIAVGVKKSKKGKKG